MISMINLFKVYIFIRYMHGTYVSYCFLKWVMSGIWSMIIWFKPDEQIEDIPIQIFEKDEYIIIN